MSYFLLCLTFFFKKDNKRQLSSMNKLIMVGQDKHIKYLLLVLIFLKHFWCGKNITQQNNYFNKVFRILKPLTLALYTKQSYLRWAVPPALKINRNIFRYFG